MATTLGLVVLLLGLTTGCGGYYADDQAENSAGSRMETLRSVDPAASEPGSEDEVGESAADAVAQAPLGTPLPPLTTGDPSRRIIKDAQVVLEVEDVSSTVGDLTTLAADLGGYVVDSETMYDTGSVGSASLVMSVPSEQFERAVDRIQRLAHRVVELNTSGTDVTQEYIDLQSEVANLEATRARVREFLDQAANVEEALRVNAELSRLEGEINQLKGRLEYLSQRTAYSTITVRIYQSSEFLTPTATPTPTPRPPWNPGETVGNAFNGLTGLLRAYTTAGIWLLLVGIPAMLPFVALVWVARWFWRRRRN